MQSPMLERTKAKIEEWRGRGTQRAQTVRERIKRYRAGGSSLSPQGLVKEVREKGLVETVRERRKAWRGGGAQRGGGTQRSRLGSEGSKEYRKEVAMEGSGAQLKVQKPRISIEA